jgi:hypothetical protein
MKGEIILKKYIFLGILLIFGLVVLSACERETVIMPDDRLHQMRVVGAATVVTSPDMAIAQIGVQTFNSEVDPAVEENNQKSQRIQEALIRQGVAEKDMKTVSFNIYPQRNYKDNRPEEIIGYQVNNTISVTIRDIGSVGKALQAAIDAGANNINGISFTLADPKSFEDEARVKAIEDAHQKAESMAQAAGFELGKIIGVNELSQTSPVIMRNDYDKSAAEAEVPISPGELELTARVELIYEIPY